MRYRYNLFRCGGSIYTYKKPLPLSPRLLIHILTFWSIITPAAVLCRICRIWSIITPAALCRICRFWSIITPAVLFRIFVDIQFRNRYSTRARRNFCFASRSFQICSLYIKYISILNLFYIKQVLRGGIGTVILDKRSGLIRWRDKA